jgi:hypothetical protein
MRTFGVVGVLVALATVGCHSTDDQRSAPKAAKRGFSLHVSSARQPGTALLSVPGIERLGSRCEGTRFGTTFLAASATEEVSLVVDGVRSSSSTLQPSERAVGPFVTSRRNVWKIVQSTEPRTIVVTISATSPAVCPYMPPATCLTMASVGHDAPGWEKRLPLRSRCD